MKQQELINNFSKQEQNILNQYFHNRKLKDPQKYYKQLLGLKEGKIKIESLEWLEDRLQQINALGKSQSLEAYKIRYGEKVGIEKYNIVLDKNRQANTGSNNAMYGVSMKQRLENKYGDKAEEKFEEFRQNVSKVTSGKNNAAYGRKNKDYYFTAWQREGLTLEECEQRYKDKSKKHSEAVSGDKNGMYGKVPSNMAGIGWSGLYKNKHYFRSLMELSYILCLEKNNIPFVSAESKICIKYYDKNKILRSYHPDFIINENEVIEIKPEKMKNIQNNILKFEAGRKWCEGNGYIFNVISPKYLDDSIIFNLYKNKIVCFSNKVEQKAVNYFKKKGLMK